MSDSIFFDTNPIIYFLERDDELARKTKIFMETKSAEHARFFSSVITDAEILLKPYKTHNLFAMQKYKAFMVSAGFFVLPIDGKIANLSAKLRAKHQNLRLADSLQIAAAISSGCDVFFTNDKRLAQVDDVNVVVLSEL